MFRPILLYAQPISDIPFYVCSHPKTSGIIQQFLQSEHKAWSFAHQYFYNGVFHPPILGFSIFSFSPFLHCRFPSPSWDIVLSLSHTSGHAHWTLASRAISPSQRATHLTITQFHGRRWGRKSYPERLISRLEKNDRWRVSSLRQFLRVSAGLQTRFGIACANLLVRSLTG